jgi:pimeloyl-ACP methyl ester carboxylesterase
MQAAAHPDRTLGAFVIGAALQVVDLPPPQFQHFEDVCETYSGWAKYNRHYWLRDYRGFVEFFMSEMFVEPHSTKQIEDAVGWGLENDAETLILTRGTRARSVEEVRAMCRRVRCPVVVVHGTEDRHVSRTYGVTVAEALCADLVLLEGCAHAPHLRDPVHVNRLLHEFVRRVA